MTGSFSLSLAAIDIHYEQFGLPRATFPFKIPYHGRTDDERTEIRRAVHTAMQRQQTDIEHVLTLLARPEVVIAALGRLDGGRKLEARVCASGQHAFLAQQEQQVIRFTSVRPAAIADAAIDLLPPHRPGPGQSVSFPIISGRPANNEDSVLRANPRSPSAQRAAQDTYRQARIRSGLFAVITTDRVGRENREPDTNWFDTETGRYLTYLRREPDGHDWANLAPADRTRLKHRLSELVSAGR